jgi:MFS family permease
MVASRLVHGAREALGVAVLCSAMLLTQSALAQTVIPLPFIAPTFGVQNSAGQQSWFTAAYSLTVGTFVLPSGRLGDMYGHRFMVQVGFAWFAMFEMVAGLIGQYTRSHVAFDVCRGLIGIGPAILLPNAIAILARLYAPGSGKKMVSFCSYAATAPNGFVLGAIFSVLIARNSKLGWYWGFYIFAITLVVIFVLSFFVIPNDEQIEQRVKHWSGGDEDREMAAKRSFDFVGTILGVSGLVLFNFAFNQALVVGWQTVYVYVLLIIGVVLFIGFCYSQRRVKDPLVPPETFKVRTSLVLGCIAFGWSSFGTFVFYSVRFLADLRQHSPLSVVAQFAPCCVSGIVAAFSSVYLLQKIRPAWVMLGAMCAFCAGNALVGTMPIGQTYWIQMFLAVAITPFGMDMSFPSASIIVSDSLPPERQGTAGSLVNTIVNYSIAFGLGLAGTVELQVNKGGQDLERGYRGALYMGIGLAGLGILCALTLLLVDHLHEKRKRDQRE